MLPHRLALPGEPAEKVQLRRTIGNQFRVPLHGNKGFRMCLVFHGFNQAIGGPAHGSEPFPQATDTLVMGAGYGAMITTHNPSHETGGIQGYRVFLPGAVEFPVINGPWKLRVQIFIEIPTVDNVNVLKPQTNGQDRFMLSARGQENGPVESLALVMDDILVQQFRVLATVKFHG